MNTIWLHSAYISRSSFPVLNRYVTYLRPVGSLPWQHGFVDSRGSQRRNMSAKSLSEKSMRRRAAIAFGSNVGNRVQNIESALKLMRERGINVVKTSPLYETQAMYYEDQGPFLNGACEVSTTQEPLALLDTLQEIENTLGRKKTIEKGPRTIDLDIVLYRGDVINTQRLTVPHPLLREREFVLRPLNDIIPDIGVPILKGHEWTELSVSKLYDHLPRRDHSISAVTELSPNLPLIRSMDPTRTTQIMAILNLTPDSFSDGGIHDIADMDALGKTVQNFVAAGATIIDVGGQSSRPGAEAVSTSEELKRILPVIRMIREMPEGRSVAISVDTFEPLVAKEGLAAGADIVNDISGGRLSNGEIFSVVADAGKTISLMHMRGNPRDMNSRAVYSQGVVHDVAIELYERVQAAVKAGIPRWRILVDPGIGFAKHLSHNLTLLRDLDKLRAVSGLAGLPWLIGTSRKRFIGRITGVDDAASRVMGTAATVTASIAGGADIVRVHDVAEIAEVVEMSDAIYRRSRGPHFEIRS